MLTQLLIPVRRRNYNTQADYDRATEERWALIHLIINIFVACWSMEKEEAEVEKKKQEYIEKMTPKTSRQTLKFLELINRKAFEWAKRKGKACPKCGYYMFPTTKSSHMTDKFTGVSPMYEEYCGMCGELIQRNYKDSEMYRADVENAARIWNPRTRADRTMQGR